MADITAVILTYNEEANIEDCIRSIGDLAKRIYVVDSFSTDRTVEIAEEQGAAVLQHPFENQARQILYFMDAVPAETTWLLRLDADERLTDRSREELRRLAEDHASDDVTGIILHFEMEFLGKKLRHGGIYPQRKLQMVKYGKAVMEDRAMDEHFILLEGRAIEAKEDCEHHSFTNLTAYVNKHNSYATREAEEYFLRLRGVRTESGSGKAERGEGGMDDFRKPEFALDGVAGFRRTIKYGLYYRLPMGIRSHLHYIYRYYLRGGFLDGREGQIFAFLQAYWYRYLVDAKIYETELEWDKKTH